MSRKIKVLIAFVVIFIIVCLFNLYSLNKSYKASLEVIEQYEEQVQLLNSPDYTLVWQTSTAVASGTTVNEFTLEQTQIPTEMFNENYVTNLDEIKTSIWKIPVAGKTLITKSMLSEEFYGQTDRVIVVAMDGTTPSLKKGDYVDIIITPPDGISRTGIPKKRVINIYQNSIEVVLTRIEELVYNGMSRDQSLNKGTTITATAYIEPTLQKRSVAMYIPPLNVVEYMALDKNIPAFPYTEESDYLEYRTYLEKAFPYYVYGEELFTTDLQALRDRDNKLVAGSDKRVQILNKARSEYIASVKELAERTGISVDEYETGMSNIYQGGGGTGQYNSDTYIDSNGVERNPDGSAVSISQDILNNGGVVPIDGEDNLVTPSTEDEENEFDTTYPSEEGGE